MASDGPRLRRDLVSTILQEDGVKCVDVQDPERAASFRLFDYEYSVALAFDGRPLAKVIPWVRLSTGLELTAEQLTAFAARLDQLGFLESEKTRAPGVAPESTPVVASADKEARTPSPTPSQPVLAEPPAAMPSQPLMEEAPASVLSQPAAVETPSPSHPALAGEKTPPPLVAESISAASPEAEAAAQETPSPDALAAAETPAAVPEQPEGPLQHQPARWSWPRSHPTRSRLPLRTRCRRPRLEKKRRLLARHSGPQEACPTARLPKSPASRPLYFRRLAWRRPRFGGS